MASLKVRVTTRSSRSGLTLENGILKAFLHSPPADGRANNELLEIVAKDLGLRKASVTLVRGEKSRDKEIEVAHMDQADLDRLVAERLS